MESTKIATMPNDRIVRARVAAFPMAPRCEVRVVAPNAVQGPQVKSALYTTGLIVSRSGHLSGSPPV